MTTPSRSHRAEPGAASRSLAEVRVRTATPEESLETLLRQSGARARLVSCRATGSNAGARLLRWLDVEAAPVDLQAFESAARRRFGADAVSASSVDRGRAIFRLSVPLPGFCPAVSLTGGLCESWPFLAPTEDGGPLPVGVLLPRNGEVARFGEELADRKVGLGSLERMGPYVPRPTLTRRQEMALRAALELGYFEYPRRAGLGEVARRLGIGRSAALELLRRALSQLARRYYAPSGAAGRR